MVFRLTGDDTQIYLTKDRWRVLGLSMVERYQSARGFSFLPVVCLFNRKWAV